MLFLSSYAAILATLLAVGCNRETSPRPIVGNATPISAANCTLYASARGDDNNSGVSPASPKTLTGAAFMTRPGSVVCLLAGSYQLRSTFYPPTGGTPSAWIVYKKFGDGDVHLIWMGGPGASDQMMVKIGGGDFPSGPAYLEFRGLKLDGQANAIAGFFCMGSHHLRFIENTITNTGGAGISTVLCDYLVSDSNVVYHNGYSHGWTSGISYNSNQWFDEYEGLHNIISNNIVAGEYDGSSKHTDGNAIILDLSKRTNDYSSANTPPVLVINNVAYGNGGRCIHAYVVSNFWVVNNTCHKNGLDLALNYAPSFSTNNSRDGYFVNNIAVAWNSRNAGYAQYGRNANIRYFRNLSFGSSNNFSHPDLSQFIDADPHFVDPPTFDPVQDGQYGTALLPALLREKLTLRFNSPALRSGVDPSTLPHLPAAIVADLKKHIYRDINGNPRPQGGRFDLGAYQMTGVR